MDVTSQAPVLTEPLSLYCGTHTCNCNSERLSLLTASNKLNNKGNLKKKHKLPMGNHACKSSKKVQIEASTDGNSRDSSDEDFEAWSGSSESDDIEDEVKITNIKAGIVKMLKEASGPMHTFYLLVKDFKSGSITQKELEIASGKLVIDLKKSTEFVAKLKAKTESIQWAFKVQ
ncbi:hypothetical protein H0H87_004705 [Tephrocybe sp. NHM501043]|nr:hypothetical protein H0H87_004705 [Tephrocybe sp. NHM501043]